MYAISNHTGSTNGGHYFSYCKNGDKWYEYNDRIDPWVRTFRELTNEGRKLYYSTKKLHNDAEIRLLTFNNIQ